MSKPCDNLHFSDEVFNTRFVNFNQLFYSDILFKYRINRKPYPAKAAPVEQFFDPVSFTEYVADFEHKNNRFPTANLLLSMSAYFIGLPPYHQ